MARRAWVVDQIAESFRATPVLLLDSGNFSDTPTAQGEVRTEALLEAMQRMGYKAVNVGERDIRMGYEDFRRRTAKSNLTFVSANIVRQADQRPVFPPHVVVEASSPDGKVKRRVGVIGVVRYNPLFLKAGPEGSNMVIVHPVDRVRQEVAALKAKQVEAIVLLAALHKDDARRIAEEVVGIDFVFGAYGGIFSPGAEQQASTAIVYSGNKGQRVGETRVFFEGGKIAREVTRMHFLTSVYPANQDMLRFVNSIPVRDVEDETPSSSRLAPAPALGAVASGAR